MADLGVEQEEKLSVVYTLAHRRERQGFPNLTFNQTHQDNIKFPLPSQRQMHPSGSRLVNNTKQHLRDKSLLCDKKIK
jgi:hypothetical protein